MSLSRKCSLIFGFLVLMGLGNSSLNAQTYIEQENNEGDIVRTNIEGPDVLRNIGFNTDPNPRNATLQSSLVSLQQIGDFNGATIKVQANASEITLAQNGDYNFATLEYKVNTVISNLVQNGNSNYLKDYVYNGTDDISLQLQQDGDNLYFERFGSNELTKSLQFRQTEASPTIIIRSFE